MQELAAKSDLSVSCTTQRGYVCVRKVEKGRRNLGLFNPL